MRGKRKSDIARLDPIIYEVKGMNIISDLFIKRTIYKNYCIRKFNILPKLQYYFKEEGK